ncbi:cache domain-containing protein [Vallitalea pronyensis]|uniref:Cache domain-containing protein n=1 Tax=Vallitalea pronyensis TaxID=1348613 RepID=A0A8J8SHP1_9FIRM|nr:cache domain-containing protein [Vallitalea pronyensis]QUI24055.1 cache domain-containing protein [Vallitalea pronyensis]
MRTFRKVKPLSYVSVAISLLIVSVAMGFFIITISYSRFELESERIREQYYAYQKKIIKNEVDSVYDYIEYYKNKSEEILRHDVQQQIYTVYDIINNYYEKNHHIKTREALRYDIAELIKGVRTNALTKYYYTIWLNDDNQVEANSNNDGVTTHIPSTQENPQLDALLKVAKEDGEGFCEYYWCDINGNQEEAHQRKLGFVKYFEPLNMVIGTGIYVDDMEDVIKEDLIDRIANIRYDEVGYFYVTTYEGKALVFADEAYVGTDVSHINDVNGVNVHIEGLKHIQDNGEGYIEYTWTKPGIHGVYPKVTFVKGLDRWQWIIGTGVYMDEIEDTIAHIERQMKKDITANLAKVLIVIGLLALFLLFFQYHVVKKIIDLLQQEDEINSIITDLSVDGILIVNRDGKIIESNRKGIELMGVSYRSIKDIVIWDFFQDPILLDDNKKNHIFKETSLVNLNGDTIPVEVHMKRTKIDRQKVYITYLRDLTKRYRYEKKLEELAHMDELTGVYNRRFIIKQIEEEMRKQEEHHETFAIAMADLDFFKRVNDTYGHTYGDEILKYFSKMLTENVRLTDYVGRYGGEEFIVIFTEQTKEFAYDVLHEIQLKIKQHVFEKKELKLTFSAGIVEIKNEDNRNIQDYLIQVDQLLYKAKGNGRDRIELS